MLSKRPLCLVFGDFFFFIQQILIEHLLNVHLRVHSPLFLMFLC